MDQVKPVSATETPLVDFEAVCQKIRLAIDSVRVYAVSLLDEKGDVLWMTEGSMGPDEHNAVVEAFEAFTKANGPVFHDYDLGDSRSAVSFRIVNTRRAMAGAVMVVMDTRGITQDDKGAARLMTPKLQRGAQRIRHHSHSCRSAAGGEGRAGESAHCDQGSRGGEDPGRGAACQGGHPGRRSELPGTDAGR